METILQFGGHRLPAVLPGEPRAVTGGLIVPAGDVRILHPFGAVDFYRHGWNSYSPTAWWPLGGPPLRIPGSERMLTADDIDNDSPYRHAGSAVGALDAGDGNVLLLGGLGLDVPRVEADDRLLAGHSEHPGADWFLGYGPEETVFARYAELLGERLGRRTTRAGNVWCSWYSFFEDITEPLIHKVLDDLRGYPFDVVQLDDGWQAAVGDWEAGADFPSGMSDMAVRIRDHGFVPGLWLAPFIAPAHSQIFQTRPHLFLRDAAGDPKPAGYNWGSSYFALDTTLPEARDHLAATFARVRDWGYRYLKLDFAYAAALSGARHGDVPREQAYREAVELIREVAGDDTYLLGSGAPIIPSIGVLDGVRASPDVAPYWDNSERSDDYSGAGARNAVIASLHRLWLRPLLEVDPDPVFFRTRYNLLDDECKRLLTDLAAICGFRAVSDPIAWLDEPERRALVAFLTGDPEISRLDRLRFLVDGREVDFGPYVRPAGRISDRLLVK
ncbi:alpha-galactosidase [Acrocarpospora phusangensis]|uniref:Alpha-galactosidase n=1 Tax=Acrocarpospora phusangensis TaxID=1070424 RepID=A0A919QA67_9ACTN|nr:glycoside hydrolase family 36 protein [Acrocarpospora phusangensis]GIH25061.1 alpha-galactosidase [Acrocarpospora phusangensis]